MTKVELRRQMRLRIGAAGNQVAEKSRVIVAAIIAHPAWARTRVVSLFSALPGEPDVAPLWIPENGAETLRKVRVCYPRIETAGMMFFEVSSPEELVPSPWHPRIREPVFAPERIVPPEEIDLILVPGLAFTRDGQRLGRGGGFYDRYLAGLPPRTMKLGVCFQCQLVETLPSEEHDQRVHAIVTENGITSDFPPITAAE